MLHGLRFLGSVFTFVGVAWVAVPLAPRHVAMASAPGDVAALDATTRDPSAPLQSCTPAEQCCKICSKGKACGNSCIRASYTCHKGRGCACNAEEVCE